MRGGTAILAAGAAAALAIPLLALGLQLPFWLAGMIGLMVFGGVWFLAQPQGVGAGLSDDAVLDAQSETARGLMSDGEQALARLRASLKAIRDDTMRQTVTGLVDLGDRVVKQVRADPSRAMSARRLLTFYMPNAASLAEGWTALEGRPNASPERMAQTRQTMTALNDAFVKYADDVSAPQLQALDLDLKVLNDALKADLET